MRCPECGKELIVEAACQSCSACGGVWFGQDQALRYFGLEGDAVQGDAAAKDVVERSGGRSCPACALPMLRVEVDAALVLDRCARCDGFFFDAGESLALRSRLAAGHDGPVFRTKVVAVLTHSTGPYR